MVILLPEVFLRHIPTKGTSRREGLSSPASKTEAFWPVTRTMKKLDQLMEQVLLEQAERVGGIVTHLQSP